MKDVTALLQKTDLLGSLSREIIHECIVSNGKRMEYSQKETVFGLKDRVSNVQILLSGKVNLVYFHLSGKCDLRAVLSPVSIVGLDLICTRTQISPYYAIAAENSEIFSFPAGILLEPGTIPEADRLRIIDQLLRALSHLNIQKDYRLAILTHHSLRERIMVYLTMQASRRRTTRFSIPFSRDEMASFLSVNRSALSHELSLLKQEGIIDFSKNEFELYHYHGPES